MEYHFLIHKEDGGYWTECLELQGCQTQADTLGELKENAREALELYLGEPENSRVIFNLPKPRPSKRNIMTVSVPPTLAFAMLLRQARVLRKLTQRQAADLLEIKHISAYQRLESPESSNPELKTLSKVKRVFPEIAIDFVLG